MKIKIIVSFVLLFGLLQKSMSQEPERIVRSNNIFGFDIFKEISKTGKSNLFISPISIVTALSMAYDGASGKTAEEMKEVLRFTTSEEQTHEDLVNLLKFYRDNNGDLFTISDAAVVQNDYHFKDSYLELLDDYETKVKYADFKNSTNINEIREEINKWVSENTGGKINDLLEESVLTPLTRLVLLNAVYFKDSWKYKFDKEKTKVMPFYISKRKKVLTDFMFSSQKYGYYQNEDLQMIEIPYEKDASFFVILPDKNKNFDEYCSEFTYDEFYNLEQKLRAGKIDLYLPKFIIESKYNLNEYLKSLGMKDAFSDSADFSKMTGSRDLTIDKVIHQSFVEVEETGTEAAASTAVVMREKSAAINPLEMKVDHPFIFIIKEKSQGAILFIGKFIQPEK